MSKQRCFFPEAQPYFYPPSSGPETSKQAAREISSKVGRLQRQVLDFITAKGAYGATREEIEIGLKMRGNTLRPRVKELEERRLIAVTDRTRLTVSGKKANVIVAVS